MAVKVINSIVYGSTEKYFGNVHVNNNIQGISRIVCNCLTPYFGVPQCVGNDFTGTPDSYVIDEEYSFFHGYVKPYLFTWDYSTLALSRQNYQTSEADTVTLDFLTDYYELMQYIPDSADTGILIIDEYSGGSPVGNIKAYSIDWISGSYSLQSEYAYSYSSDYYAEYVVGVVKYGQSFRVVISFYVWDDGASVNSVDFLVYTTDTGTFSMVEMDRDYQTWVRGVGSHICAMEAADLGDGKLAVLLGGNYASVAFVDTSSGTAYHHSLEDYGDYIASIAPYYVDNSAYLILEHTATGALAMLHLTSAGVLTVINEDYDYPGDDNYVVISYSKESIVASFTDYASSWLIFYDMVNDTELFRIPNYEYIRVSRTMDDSNNLIILKEIYEQTLEQGLAMSFTDVVQATGEVYPSAWGWDGWDYEAASLQYRIGYRPSGLYSGSYNGWSIKGRTNAFPSSEYVLGDLVLSQVVPATATSDIDITSYLTEAQRYAITSEGSYVSNNTTSPADTLSTKLSIGFSGVGYSEHSTGYGKEGQDLGAASMVLPSYPTYANVIPYARANASNPNNAEIYFFHRDGYSAYMCHGDNLGWTGDNEGSITLKIHEAHITRRELAASFPANIPVVVGQNVTVRLIDKVDSISNDHVNFMQVRFTDGTYAEVTSYTNSGVYKVFTYTLAETGKTIEEIVVGAYLGTLPTVIYRVDMLITDVEVPIGTTGEVRRIDKIDTSGSATEIVDISSVDGHPSIYDAEDIPFLRLVDNAIIYSVMSATWNKYPVMPLVVHFGED